MKLKNELSEFLDHAAQRILPKHPTARTLSLLLLGALLAAVAIIGPWTGTGLIHVGMEYATFPMQRQRIEVVREALTHIPCGVEGMTYQSIVSQALVWNTRIAHEKEANRRWYADPFSPDWWLAVPALELPDCRQPTP